MKSMTTYLNFDGNAREAMTFYHKCLGGEFEVQTFGEAHAGGPNGSENRIIHARITNGNTMLMASDTMPGMNFVQGNNFSIAIECDDHAEQDRHFAAFAEGGTITMPLDMMFWGARFGMIRDKFGVNWMFNCDTPKS